ncbi:MAG TPA: Ig-like domain-containing protein, partial [Vicinamibacterales bacterium]
VLGGRGIRWATIVSLFWLAANGSISGGVEARQSTPPATWSDQDIGSPAVAGSASSITSGLASNPASDVTITAGGRDIWGTSDEFHFVYQRVNGDVDVRARVDSITYAAPWSKAGVMIRGSLAPDAAHGFALVSAGRGTAFQRRTVAAGLSTDTAGPGVAAPQWARLVRQGRTITAYTSADGVTWTLTDSDTIDLPAVTYVGLAVTSHSVSSATTASLSGITVQPLAAPAGQQDIDIGNPDIAGSMTYADGIYQIQAAGSDVWDTSDQFNYVYQPVSGDVDVSVRIDSITFADAWSKAGLMIRETLSAGSAHAFALVSAGRGVAFQRRPVADQETVSTSGSSAAPPDWVRLKRNGSLFTAYESSDGSTWTVIGSDTIPMADSVYVGIAATSHNVSVPTDVVADSLTIAQSTVNQPPVVNITSPADGSTFTADATITITASASDPQNELTQVEFYNGTSLLGTATTAPYTFSWSSVPPGTYALSAIAYDAAGLTTQSAPVSVTVTTDQAQPPVVSLTSPADGSTFTEPATITITANASDPQNQLTQVEFYSGTTLLGTATTAPYTVTWISVPAGTDSLTAIAYDAAGLTTQSAAVSVTVNSADGTPPTGVVFAASTDNAAVTYYQLDVFAAGDDPTTATPVASLNGGMPTPDASNNMTISAPDFFNALPPGNYQLTISAVDSSGLGRSAPVAFTR